MNPTRTLIFIFAMLFSAFAVQAQTVEFSDDFESGTAGWTLSGAWGLSTAQFYGGANSLTDSPAGNYAANQNISATLASGVDLTGDLDANLTFWTIYDIENGNFDYCYVEASGDGGATWTTLEAIFGEGNLGTWVQRSYSLGGFVGNSDVRVRFRFFSDGGYEVDGIYIDDVEITSSNVDNSAPLITHAPPEFYESTLGAITMVADIVDVSGVSSASLSYSVDGGSGATVAGTNTSGDTYEFAIPAQAVGAQVDYDVTATDDSNNSNAITAGTFSYIAGNHIFYDNAATDFVNVFSPSSASGTGCAVRFSLDGTTDVAYALIRNYTDPNRPNMDMEFHIWADDGAGLPGADLITPFTVTPEANLMVTSPMTRVDLRPYANELSGICGDVFMGFMAPNGDVWVTQTTPASGMSIGQRTYVTDGTDWILDPADDFHFRLVTEAIGALPQAAFTTDNTGGDGIVVFTDASDAGAVSWVWDFGDGATSTVQNPTYQYTSSGTYNVCLTSTYNGCSDTQCETVNVVISNTENVEDGYSVIVYPNPFSDRAVIEVMSTGNLNDLEARLFNIMGQEINCNMKQISNGIEIHRGNLNSGTYIYELTNKDGIIAKGKLMIK